MANTTWNFPCWRWRDMGPALTPTSPTTGNRGSAGAAWASSLTGSVAGDDLPFSDSITIIGAFLMSSEYTARRLGSNFQVLFDIGVTSAKRVSLTYSVGTGALLAVGVYDDVANVTRYDIGLQDDDGTTGFLEMDKWYQFAFSINGSGIVYAMNGNTSPSVTVATNSPGDLNIDNGNTRLWHAANAETSATTYGTVTSGWPSAIMGPMAAYAGYIDLSDADVRGRIFDSNGDLKNPGEDGSLWFGDTYGAIQPDLFFHDGGIRVHSGTFNPAQAGGWYYGTSNNDAAGVPGGLRKQWELSTTIGATLTAKTTAWWGLSEASGNRADSKASYTLTDNNTVGSDSGLVYEYSGTSRAASFVAANSEFLDRPSAEPSVFTPDTSWAISAIYTVDTDHTGTIASVVGATGSEFSWKLERVAGGTDVMRFSVSATGDVADVVTVETSEGVSTSGRHHVVAWYDSTNGKIGICANNGKYVTATFTGPVFDAAVPFALGCLDPDGTPNGFWNGDMDQVAFFGGTLTRNEIAYLCNFASGNAHGRPYHSV